MAFRRRAAARAAIVYVAPVPVTSEPELARRKRLEPTAMESRWAADLLCGRRRHDDDMTVGTSPSLTVGTPEQLFKLQTTGLASGRVVAMAVSCCSSPWCAQASIRSP